MKVYELMSVLAGLESGADVKCSGLLTVPELESGETCGEDEFGDEMHPVQKDICSIESEDDLVYLNF